MTFWIRSATVQLGDKSFSLDDLYFEFDVPFEDSEELTSIDLTVYNLSSNTRNSLKKGDQIIINAGYEDDIGTIFVGQISTISHSHDTTDWKTKITATEALEEWLTASVNKTYTKNITAQDMVQDLLNIFGVEIGTFELAINKVYPRGRVCKGKLKDVLTEIVVSECKSRFLIHGGRIIINNPEDGVNRGYLLSPETGLLRSDDDAASTNIETDLDTQKTPEQKNEESVTKTRKCLLNYHIGPGDIIVIQSADLNGQFRVLRGRHTGNPRGDWITEVEVQPA